MFIKKYKNFHTGFTLLELIIAITIVIVLSTISIPIYRNYFVGTKMAEAYTLLSAVKEAQMSYYTEWGNFYHSSISYTSFNPILGVDARLNKYVSCFNIMSGNNFEFLSGVDVRTATNTVKYLFLNCNITSGQTLYETPNWNGVIK